MMFWAKVKLAAAVLLGTAVVLGGGTPAVKVAAGEPAKDNAAVPYPDDPAIIGQLEALGDNTALRLPPFKMVGDELDKWRALYPAGPMVRGYCDRMPYALERQTGMYCGGGHNVPHKTCDLWEFHLGSNTWHLTFPPYGGNHRDGGDLFNITNADWCKKNVTFKDGYIQTNPGGGFVLTAHTWDAISYDPDAKRLLWVQFGWNDLKAYAAMTGQNHEELKKQAKGLSGLWAFDAAARKWIPLEKNGPTPPFAYCGTLQYIPELKKTIYYNGYYQFPNDWMWSYDSATNTWQNLKPNNGKAGDTRDTSVLPCGELQAAYSPKHKKIVLVADKSTYAYDLARNEWARVCEDADFFAHDGYSTFAYDSVNDVFLLLEPTRKKRLQAFSLATGKWETLTPQGAALPGEGHHGPGYYDPRLNIFVHYGSDKAMWAYRYKRAAK